MRVWHKCSPCEVIYHGVVAPTIFLGQKASKMAVAGQLQSVCLEHLVRRRCLQGASLGSSLRLVTVTNEDFDGDGAVARNALQTVMDFGLATQSIQLTVAEWERSLLEDEEHQIEGADLVILDGPQSEIVLQGD